jgi:Coenzyme PQQ synthesis protein D (PqqD)
MQTIESEVNHCKAIGGREMVRIAPNLRSIVDHNGAVILNIAENAITNLNVTGAYIWQRLERGLQVDEIIVELARDTETDKAEIARDLTAFLLQLNADHLIALSTDDITQRPA